MHGARVTTEEHRAVSMEDRHLSKSQSKGVWEPGLGAELLRGAYQESQQRQQSGNGKRGRVGQDGSMHHLRGPERTSREPRQKCGAF